MSELTDLQEILRRRLGMGGTVGYAGGTLDDQLNRDQAPAVQAPMPNRPNGWTGPGPQRPFPTKEVAPPAEALTTPDQTRQRAVSYDVSTGEPKRDFYKKQGGVEGAIRYENAVIGWDPRGRSGYKRGFLNTLKAVGRGALMGASSTPENPIAGAVGGAGAGAVGSAINPSLTGSLSRAMKMRRAVGETDLQLQHAKAESQIEQGQMMPVTLNNGNIVMVPAHQAATLQSQQQRIGQQEDMIGARIQNWDSLAIDRRKKRITAQYKAGMLQDPKSLEYAARELGIPGDVMPAFLAGEMYDRLDDDGNIIQISRRTGVAKPVTQEGQPVTSYEKTKEKGRERRAIASEAGKNVRQQRAQASMDRRAAASLAARGTGSSGGLDKGNKGPELAGKLAAQRRVMETLDYRIGEIETQLGKNPNDTAAQTRLAAAKTARENALIEATAAATTLKARGYDAGIGEKGFPYVNMPKQGQTGGRTIEGAIGAFRKTAKRDPTDEEIEIMRKKLGQ